MPDSLRQAPQSHAEVIGLWPDLATYAADIGVEYETAKQQRRRSSIADDYRPAVIEKARARGIRGVTYALLTKTAPKRASRKVRR